MSGPGTKVHIMYDILNTVLQYKPGCVAGGGGDAINPSVMPSCFPNSKSTFDVVFRFLRYICLDGTDLAFSRLDLLYVT